jgi:hypothetical protein
MIAVALACACSVSAWLLITWILRVRASDRFIDELAAGVSTASIDDELVAMLTAWRRDVVDTPYAPSRGGHEPDPGQ